MIRSCFHTFVLMYKSVFVTLLVISFLILVSCQGKNAENKKVQLTVSIIPQKYLVNYIAGGKCDVQAMLPTGSNHETYEPAPRDMEKISDSKLYFALGSLDFELTWLDRLKATNPGMQVIETGKGIKFLNGHIHHHEGETDKSISNPSTDPHTWLSTDCMKIQAANICEALSTLDTTNAAFYQNNLNAFTHLADSVNDKIRKKLITSEGKTILIFHPALAYFCREYGLTQISIEQDGKEPSPAYMAELVKTAREKGIKAIFISKEFDTRNAEAIAHEIGGKVVVFDPMAENWPANMIQLAQLIAEN